MNKGKLKIFLGMAAGVGKTYTMLEEAQKKRTEGVEVIIGLVDTHGRPETEKLLGGLSIIPLKTVPYKNREFKELDCDEIIRLRPQLVLIDELAHTNIPGSKHLKRWQDVMEILEHGIDVYATINIQHIESYKDIIEEITGVKIRETVPDLILENADEIEFVDITPIELLKRLKEGKVYTGEFSAIALQNFFQEDRLTALREIALRFTAEKVKDDLHQMLPATKRGWTWRDHERLLVAINHKPDAQHLIRATRRLAFKIHAPWSVLYVDTGGILNEQESLSLAKNFALARELGAEVMTTQDEDICSAIHRIAQQEGSTQIIIGKSDQRKLFRAFRRTLADQISSASQKVDVLIVHHPHTPLEKKRGFARESFVKGMISCFKVFIWVAIVTLLNLSIFKSVGYPIVGGLYLVNILLMSLFFRFTPLIFGALLQSVGWVLFFLPRWDIENIGYLLLFFLMAGVAGLLSSRSKKREEHLNKKERSTQAIYEIVREISSAPTSKELLERTKIRLGKLLQGTCDILIKESDDGLRFDAASLEGDEKERAVANWVFENGKEAGWSTFTLPSSRFFYIPLKGFKEIVGVLAFKPESGKRLLPEESNLLHTAGQQLAHFLERSFDEEREFNLRVFRQNEQIYAKILQSISNQLYHPLKMIQNSIADFSRVEDTLLKASLHQIVETSDNLLRIAENAKAMARLSSGGISFKKSLYDIEQWIHASCEEMEGAFKNHHLTIHIQQPPPVVSFDWSLLTILFRHLLYNAIEYSPLQSTIIIEAEVYNGNFALSVSDEGMGIPEEVIERVFEKFYQVEGTSSTGLGLGLAIVKSIAEIHHGMIKVRNRPTSGTTFSLILPL